MGPPGRCGGMRSTPGPAHSTAGAPPVMTMDAPPWPTAPWGQNRPWCKQSQETDTSLLPTPTTHTSLRASYCGRVPVGIVICWTTAEPGNLTSSVDEAGGPHREVGSSASPSRDRHCNWGSGCSRKTVEAVSSPMKRVRWCRSWDIANGNQEPTCGLQHDHGVLSMSRAHSTLASGLRQGQKVLWAPS